MKQNGFPIVSVIPRVICRVFVDNTSALEIAKASKSRPRTKHSMNNWLYHFRSQVDDSRAITLHRIDVKDQLADYLTKPLNTEVLAKLRELMMGR